MQYLIAFIPLIVGIVALVVLVLLIRGGVKMMWQVAEPNEALIISGFSRGRPLLLPLMAWTSASSRARVLL
ncbi:hypothetical protein NHF46_14220 [Arthrobacter alpinus]|nr:hypothetical protein [Arthrobacter alpinus]